MTDLTDLKNGMGDSIHRIIVYPIVDNDLIHIYITCTCSNVQQSTTKQGLHLETIFLTCVVIGKSKLWRFLRPAVRVWYVLMIQSSAFQNEDGSVSFHNVCCKAPTATYNDVLVHNACSEDLQYRLYGCSNLHGSFPYWPLWQVFWPINVFG